MSKKLPMNDLMTGPKPLEEDRASDTEGRVVKTIVEARKLRPSPTPQDEKVIEEIFSAILGPEAKAAAGEKKLADLEQKKADMETELKEMLATADMTTADGIDRASTIQVKINLMPPAIEAQKARIESVAPEFREAINAVIDKLLSVATEKRSAVVARTDALLEDYFEYAGREAVRRANRVDAWLRRGLSDLARFGRIVEDQNGIQELRAVVKHLYGVARSIFRVDV